MYRLDDYGAMIADRVRTDAYVAAIARTVRPGDVVIDLGCGPGLLTILACHAGAKRVYAIEANESISYARQLISANGLEDRVQLLHGLSSQLDLPERGDVIVSDVRGVLPLSGVATLEDARRRFLKEGGILIPASDTLYAGLVSVPEYYSKLLAPWQSAPGGAELSAVLPNIANMLYTSDFQAQALVSQSEAWHTLDYSRSERNPTGQVCLQTTQEATVHGICLWFRTTLVEDIGYSTGPADAETVYGQGFLPFPEPIVLRGGQEVQVSLRARVIGGNSLWCWDTVFEDRTGATRKFQQSTFGGAPLSREVLERRDTSYVPKCIHRAQANGWILLAMDGKRSLRTIADEAARRFPDVFADAEQALECAVQLAERFVV